MKHQIYYIWLTVLKFLFPIFLYIVHSEVVYFIFQCCSLEKATRIIGISCLVLSAIGLFNTIFNFKALGSVGTGVYMLIAYSVNAGIDIVLLQGVKRKSE